MNTRVSPFAAFLGLDRQERPAPQKAKKSARAPKPKKAASRRDFAHLNQPDTPQGQLHRRAADFAAQAPHHPKNPDRPTIGARITAAAQKARTPIDQN